MRPLTGERKAIAAAVLAFYGFIFLLLSLAPPPGWGKCFAALAGVYGLGFFAIVAGYFWARWFAMGLGLSGAISAAISVFQVGPEPVLMFYGGTHLLIAAVMWGRAMSGVFDGRKEWRTRFRIDDNSTHKLGKAIVRAGISLPYILMYALAPRADAATMALVVGGAGLAVAGVWGLTRVRTWGIFALAGAAVALAASLGQGLGYVALGGYVVDMSLVGLTAVALLAVAVAPFARPMFRYLRESID